MYMFAIHIPFPRKKPLKKPVHVERGAFMTMAPGIPKDSDIASGANSTPSEGRLT